MNNNASPSKKKSPNQQYKIMRVLKIVALMTTACSCLHLLGRALFRRLRPSLTAKELLYMAELLPSTVHALVVGTLATKAVLVDRVWANDVVEPFPKQLDLMFGLSAGYALHDLLVMFLHGEHITLYWHHIVMLVGSVAMLFHRRSAYFPVWFYMSELTVPLQNVIYYRLTMQPESTNDRVMRTLYKLRLLVFLTMRTFITPAMWIYLQKRLIDVPRVIEQMPKFIFYGSAANIASLTILNSLWTYAVAKKALS